MYLLPTYIYTAKLNSLYTYLYIDKFTSSYTHFMQLALDHATEVSPLHLYLLKAQVSAHVVHIN